MRLPGGVRSIALTFLVFTATLSAALGQGSNGIPEPATYRGPPYQAPVPETLTGAVVLSTEAAHALWSSGRAGFVDVLPRVEKPANLPAGTIWRDRRRNSIPGAIWMPNVGYQHLADVTLEYLKRGLSEISASDRDAPLVFFCLEDCWMSWNAARRAIALGYRRVYWYPEGSDGWQFMDYPTEILEPWQSPQPHPSPAKHPPLN